MSKRIILVSVAVALTLLGLLPLFTMIAKSLVAGGQVSLSAYAGLFASSRQWSLLSHSILLSALTTVLVIAAGVPLGMLLGRTDLPLRRLFTVVPAIPLMVPPYVMAVSWADFLGPQGWLASVVGSSLAATAYRFLFGLPGCVFVFFSTFLPIVILLTMASSTMVQPRYEEAARLVCRWPGVLRRVTVPLMWPGISLAGMLVFLLTLGEYSVPNFLRYDVYPVESFIQFSAFYNVEAATAMAVPLAVITLVILLIEWSFFRERIHPGAAVLNRYRSEVVPLGKYRHLLVSVMFSVCTVFVILPLLVLLAQSLPLSTYEEALHRASDSLARSVFYAALGATVLTFVGFFIGYLIHTRALRFWRAVDTMTIFLFALPSTVIGIGLVTLWNSPWSNFIYASAAIIVLGYLIKYVALASRIVASSLGHISPALEEAAQVSGVPWTMRLHSVVSPAIKRGILAAWLVAYIFCLRDTEITMMVYPPGHETLPVRTLTLMANGSAELIAALCIIMIIATVVPPGLIWLSLTVRKEREVDGSH